MKRKGNRGLGAPHWLGRLPIAFFALLSVTFLSPRYPSAEEERPSEYAVKAAFLYNFTKFVDWPAASFSPDDPLFHLCVLGSDPFGASLDTLAEKTVGPRRIAVHRWTTAEQAKTCHMIFISTASETESRDKLHQLRGKTILTVGEVTGFAAQGGVIGFVLTDGHIRFEINPEAAATAHLVVQSSLLRLATIVKGGE
jgi:hypothetical protein